MSKQKKVNTNTILLIFISLITLFNTCNSCSSLKTSKVNTNSLKILESKVDTNYILLDNKHKENLAKFKSEIDLAVEKVIVIEKDMDGKKITVTELKKLIKNY